MALTVNVDDTLARIRRESDIETTDQANSICTDADLTDWLNDAYRELYEIVSEVAGQERFGKSATINHTTGALPTDFYRMLGIDWAPDGTTLSAQQFNFGQRNMLRFFWRPLVRLDGGKLTWEPPENAPTADYTLRYVPTPVTLAGGGTFDSIAGWDTFCVLWVKLKVRAKQEYPIDEVAAELSRQEARVRRGAARMSDMADTIEDATFAADFWYFNG
jgi:hypothetical protein